MSEHHAHISWKKNAGPFTYEAYDRAHEWTFGGGVTVPASAAPEYRGDASRVNPEEALVAAMSSCHMLTFLALAARKKWTVISYEDSAVGVLEKNELGKLAITRATLKPRVGFEGAAPPRAELEALHEQAHKGCFIASSVRTEINLEIQDT